MVVLMGEEEETCSLHHTLVKEVTTITLNGEERQVYHYAGCERCPSTWDRKPLLEMDLRGKNKYPYHSPNFISNHDATGNLTKKMMHSLRDSVNGENQLQNLNNEKLKQNILEIEKHLHLLRSKLAISKKSAKRKAEDGDQEEDSGSVVSVLESLSDSFEELSEISLVSCDEEMVE